MSTHLVGDGVDGLYIACEAGGAPALVVVDPVLTVPDENHVGRRDAGSLEWAWCHSWLFCRKYGDGCVVRRCGKIFKIEITRVASHQDGIRGRVRWGCPRDGAGLFLAELILLMFLFSIIFES